MNGDFLILILPPAFSILLSRCWSFLVPNERYSDEEEIHIMR